MTQITPWGIHLLREWAAALLSGEFAQGESVLRDGDDHYCCLGVICELRRRANPEVFSWISQEAHDDYRRKPVFHEFEGAASVERQALDDVGYSTLVYSPFEYAPTSIMDMMGLRMDGSRMDDVSWVLPTPREPAFPFSSLSAANDAGVAFSAIAAALNAYADELEAELAP